MVVGNYKKAREIALSKIIMNKIFDLENQIIVEGSKIDKLAWGVVKEAYLDEDGWHTVEKVIPAYRRVRKALSGDFLIHPCDLV